MVDIPILLKRNASTGVTPLVGDLQLGEVAVNTFDGHVFMKKDDGVEGIVRVGDLENDDSPSLSATLDANSNDVQNVSTLTLTSGASIFGDSSTGNKNMLTLAADGSEVLHSTQLSMQSNKIVNITDPTAAQDAATKAYVDSQVSSTNELGELTDVTLTAPAAGDLLIFTGTGDNSENQSVSGDITINASGVATIGADAVDHTKIELGNNSALVGSDFAGTGDVALIKANASDQAELPTATLVSTSLTLGATATFDAGANALTNLADPTNAQDAATKAYVDQEVSAALVQAVVYQGTADGSAVDEETATGDTGFTNGDMYRITVSGSTAFGFQVNVGDYVIYNGTTWNRIDAVDANVSGTAGRVSVTGDETAGYTVDIDATFGLSGLADADTTGVADGNILQYVAANSQFEAVAAIDGGSY